MLHIVTSTINYFNDEFRSIQRKSPDQFYLVCNKMVDNVKMCVRLVMKNYNRIFEIEEVFLGTKCYSLFTGVEEVQLCKVKNQIVSCNYFEHLQLYRNVLNAFHMCMEF